VKGTPSTVTYYFIIMCRNSAANFQLLLITLLMKS